MKKSTATLKPIVIINAHLTAPKGDTVYIEWFHVPESDRRRGIGTSAYKKWERSLPKHVKIIQLHSANESDPFWESLGFGWRYDFEYPPAVSSKLYEASREMVKGIRGKKTPKPVWLEEP